jgi:hypothetical protein
VNEIATEVGKKTDEQHPYTFADPRSLSEAWRNALYGPKVQKTERPVPVAEKRAPIKFVGGGSVVRQTDPSAPVQPSLAVAAPHSGRAHQRSIVLGAAPSINPITQPSEIESAQEAKRNFDYGIERSQQHMTLRDSGDPVRLLIQQLGSDLRVVAVTSHERSQSVAESLDRVRKELAARGIRLQVDHHEEHSPLL